MKHCFGILSGISFDIISEILSDISSDILSCISSDILSGLFLTFDSIWHIFCISADILSGVLFGIPSDARLQSGGEHCCRELAVEARRGTLPSGAGG